MRFILEDEFSKFFKEEDIIAEKITFMQEDIYQLVHKTEISNKTSLLNFLNSLCNQGITDINLQAMNYMINGKCIPVVDLARSEKLYLVCYISVLRDKTVFVKWDFKQLSAKNKKEFVRYFKYNDKTHRVNVLIEGEGSLFIYNKLLQEV